MAKKKVLILGAGLAGLSAAWHLQRKGIACRVFEKESEVGGLCRSKKIGGFIFDYSGHLLHFRHRYTFNLVKALLGDNLIEHKRSAWIYSHDRYTHYPFQANLYGLPASIVKECLLGRIEALKNGYPENPSNFLDWINKKFGSGIARHFMVPYNKKFWTVSPEKMSCGWLDNFVPVPSLLQVIEGTIQESNKTLGYNAHFWNPKKGGIGKLALSFANQIKNISTSSPVAHIDISKKEIKVASGNKEKYDYLISTIPLPNMPKLIEGLPRGVLESFKKLRWNSIYNLNIGVSSANGTGKHWAYFPEKEISFFRVGFYHNFSPYLAPSGLGSLYVEVSYSRNKAINKAGIISRIETDLKDVGILTDREKILCKDINDIEYGYPIYDKNYQGATKAISNYFYKNNIIPCGRYGSWRYMSMEDVLLDGKEVVKHIV